MAVISKHLIDQKVAELEYHLAELKQVLDGRSVFMRDGAYYVSKPEMVKDLREVNTDKLLTAVGHYKVSLDAIARLKRQAIKPSTSPLFFPEEEQF